MRRIVIIAAVISICASCSSSSDDAASTTVTTEPPTTTATTTASATSAASEGGRLAAARATLDAWSTSADAFVARFVPSGSYGGVPIVEAEALDSLGFYIGLGDQVQVHACESSKRLVECTVTNTDKLSGTQGYSFEGVAWMVINEDGLVVTYDWYPTGDGGGKLAYTEEMVGWVREAHPDVFEESFADSTCTPERLDCWGDWAESAEAATALLELHPAYLAAG